MNILPKKRWHVRTKDNIARVRRDEAEAKEKERVRQEKLEFAESEARINFLRKKSGVPEKCSNASQANSSLATKDEELPTSGHVDLFADFKTHIKTTNKDLEKEKKDEQEKYEKQIGYLTYLGQDTNEALKLRSWYEVAPKREVVGKVADEKDLKAKQAHDPLTLIHALLPPDKAPTISSKRKRSDSPSSSKTAGAQDDKKPTKTPDEEPQTIKKHKKDKKHKKGKRHKKEKKSKREKEQREKEVQQVQQQRDKLERLRKERLRREASERARQEALLAPKVPEPKEIKTIATPRIVQKYNSQFNPELAKQNML